MSTLNVSDVIVETLDQEFEEIFREHYQMTYRTAYGVTGNPADAEDVVQEACLRSLRYFRSYSGGNGRAWFLRIVRNTCHGWHTKTRRVATDEFECGGVLSSY